MDPRTKIIIALPIYKSAGLFTLRAGFTRRDGFEIQRIAYRHYLKAEPVELLGRAADTMPDRAGLSMGRAIGCIEPFPRRFDDQSDVERALQPFMAAREVHAQGRIAIESMLNAMEFRPPAGVPRKGLGELFGIYWVLLMTLAVAGHITREVRDWSIGDIEATLAIEGVACT